MCTHIPIDNNVTDVYGCDVCSEATDHPGKGCVYWAWFKGDEKEMEGVLPKFWTYSKEATPFFLRTISF